MKARKLSTMSEPYHGGRIEWLADETTPDVMRGKLLKNGELIEVPQSGGGGLAVRFVPITINGKSTHPIIRLNAERTSLQAAISAVDAVDRENEAARRENEKLLDAIPADAWWDIENSPGVPFRNRADGTCWVVVGYRRKRVWDDFEDDMRWKQVAGVRPATQEEIDDLLGRVEAAKVRKAAQADLMAVGQEIMKAGERPDGSNVPEGKEVPAGGGQRIYGGGRWFVLGSEWIWYVQNNGHDGDDWSSNNVQTGGAGAIGFRVPATDLLTQRIRSLASVARFQD